MNPKIPSKISCHTTPQIISKPNKLIYHEPNWNLNSLPQLSQAFNWKWSDRSFCFFNASKGEKFSFSWCIKNVYTKYRIRICFPTFIDYINYCDKNNNFLHLMYSIQNKSIWSSWLVGCFASASHSIPYKQPKTEQKHHHHRRECCSFIINNGNKLILYF